VRVMVGSLAPCVDPGGTAGKAEPEMVFKGNFSWVSPRFSWISGEGYGNIRFSLVFSFFGVARSWIVSTI
jgi:hypothetical protein